MASPRLDELDETHRFEILKLNTVLEWYCKDQLSSMECWCLRVTGPCWFELSEGRNNSLWEKLP